MGGDSGNAVVVISSRKIRLGRNSYFLHTAWITVALIVSSFKSYLIHLSCEQAADAAGLGGRQGFSPRKSHLFLIGPPKCFETEIDELDDFVENSGELLRVG